MLHRQHLSRGAAVSVVTVGTRVLVLGTTEHQVRVLTELDPDEVVEHLRRDRHRRRGAHRDADPVADAGEPIELPAPRPRRPPRPHRGRQAPAATPAPPTGALTGSVLSADTWRQALAAATRRAS